MIVLQEIKTSAHYFQPIWVLIIILLGITILGYTYSSFTNRFINSVKAIIQTRFAVQLSRDERAISHPMSVFLTINFVLITSLFILQLITSNLFFESAIKFSFSAFLLIAAAIVVVYISKIILLKFFSFIIDKSISIGEYIFTLFLINQILGIILIPAVIFISYSDRSLQHVFIYLGVAGILISFFIRLGKGVIMVFERDRAPLFYIILYLCAFEILPIFLATKVIEKLV